MYSRASHSTGPLQDYDPDAMFSGDEAPEAFFPGEPISEPPLRRRNPVRTTYLFLCIALAGGASAVNFRSELEPWTSKIAAAVASQLSHQQPSAPHETVPQEEASAPETSVAVAPSPAAENSEPLPEVIVMEAPGADRGGEPSETASGMPATDAYSAPRTTAADPYAKRAEAVGLHPDLSRALLSQLTPADYRNAAFAIDKALKTVPNDKEFEWPTSRKKGSAIFNIHFVAGGGHDCRRYVVTVTKDRWTTTALPMERCGIKLASRETARKPSIE